jgi:hypothetical protein
MSREFTMKPAVREAVPLIVGLVGPSGSGKTYSALRLASGIQRIAGGKIAVVDTEARRSLSYADTFSFDHVEFKAPFGPLDYLDAIEYAAAKGAKTIVVDSASHEHEGPGGVLEQHESEMERLAAAWKTSRDKVNMSAWQKPKSDRRRLLNTMIQMPVNFILCFRAKEKMDLRGDKPRPLGWMPIAGEEYVYESTVTCLLMPGAGGVPAWHPAEMGEKAIIKLPGKLAPFFPECKPLSEETGEQLAQWAAGAPPFDRKRVEAEIWKALGHPSDKGWFHAKFGKFTRDVTDDELVQFRTQVEGER